MGRLQIHSPQSFPSLKLIFSEELWFVEMYTSERTGVHISYKNTGKTKRVVNVH